MKSKYEETSLLGVAREKNRNGFQMKMPNLGLTVVETDLFLSSPAIRKVLRFIIKWFHFIYFQGFIITA